MGDEHVFAANVEESETFCHILQAYLQSRTELRVEVINGGVIGYCPLLNYLQYRHHFMSLQPDLVLQMFELGDIADDHQYRRVVRLNDADVPLLCTHHSFREKENSTTSFWDKVLTVRWLKGELGNLPEPATSDEDSTDLDVGSARYAWVKQIPSSWNTPIKHALSPLIHLQQCVENHHAEFLTVVIPNPWQVSTAASQNEKLRIRYSIPANTLYPDGIPQEVISRYCIEKQIPFLDALPYFRQQPSSEELFLDDSTRLSKTGHELMARLLAHKVISSYPGIWTRDKAPELSK